MKFNTNKIVVIVIIILLGITILLLSKIISTDYSSAIPEEKTCPRENFFNLQNHIKNLNSSDIQDKFPYNAYVDSADYCNISSIHYDLRSLYTINPDNNANQKILVKALTSKLKEKISPSFTHFNPDSLIILLQWINRLNNYKDIDSNNVKLYRKVHLFWILFISNKLGQYHDSLPDLIYNYKYKFLVSLCQSQNFSPDIKISNSEKIIDYFINKRWSYLFYRFWNGTSIIFKLLLFIITLFTFYSYYCVYKLNFKKNKL